MIRWRLPASFDRFVLAILAIALVYVLLRLSPSSYALALEQMGVPARPLLGEAHEIRSDEWAVWTPYIQAAVNNNFARFNLTSIYREDFRNFNAVPLADWGLLFKPEFWAFFVLEPARAFSIYHASFMAAFVIGWYGLFCRLGFSRFLAACGSLCFFYTAATQGWWTTIGPVIAVFPFLPWILLSNLHPLLRAALAAWVSAVWLIAHLYPPIVISLTFGGAALVLAFRPDVLRKPVDLAATASGAIVGAAIAFFYLHEPILAMAATVFPGQRLSAGGSMHVAHWLGQIIPQFSTLGPDWTYLPQNYLEATTAATYLPVLALCFAGPARLRELANAPEHATARRQLAVLTGAFFAMSIWQVVPLPSFIGAPLLWDRAPGHRFIFATGAILIAASLIILRAAPPAVTPKRVGLAVGVLLISFLLSKGILATGHFQRGIEELYAVAPLPVLLLFRRVTSERQAQAVVAAAVACGVVAFGFYNPYQSAWPIFHRPQSPVAAALLNEQRLDPRGWAVRPGIDGAILNGWGLPSFTHVLIRPQLDFFRRLFPEMAPEEYNQTFNRYAHIMLKSQAEPSVPQPDVIYIPIARAQRPWGPLE